MACKGLWEQNFGFSQITAMTAIALIRSLFQPVAEFLDYGVGQHFFGNALDLCLCSSLVQPAIHHQLKEFSLPNGANAFVTHLLQRALDGLSLRIKDRALQHDRDVGLHGWNRL